MLFLMWRASCYNEVFMEFEKWLDKNNTAKHYSHFDSKDITIKSALPEITNPNLIATHSFMPFIHTQLIFNKYSQKGRKPKIRELYYSSHYDRCIYQYYSYLINEAYNKKVEDSKISDVAIAYRNNLGKSNVHFAKEAFDFIKKTTNCLIIVGDFEKFFDTLEPQYLKKQLCSVLGYDKLPIDFYKVFKSLTSFSYVNFSDLLAYYKLADNPRNRTALNHKKLIMPIQVLRKNKQLIKTNKTGIGIPQGSAMSAVLSNVYMLEFDKMVKDYIRSVNGLYLRYSDDSIFIIPLSENPKTETITNYHDKIRTFIEKIPNLILQKEKTKIYTYCNGELQNQDSLINGTTNSKNIIDYLGFSFNGKLISVRDKTISKYYYRAYKKADSIAKRDGLSPKGNHISCRNLYKTYSVRGAKVTKDNKGNFISYIKRCTNIFGDSERVHLLLNTHLGKLKKRAKKKIKTEKRQ